MKALKRGWRIVHFLQLLMFVAVLLAGALDIAAQSGGNFSITRAVIAGGGGTSSGGSYVLSGTIGQPVAGTSEGGSYAVAAGFWVPEALTLFTPPEIVAPMKIGGEFQLSFSTIAGRNYIVEFTDSLFQPNWQPLPAVTGTGHLETVIDPAAGADQRFYRIRME
jgi:hypothetical protein